MHKTLGGISIVLVSALLLAGCGSQEEEPAAVQSDAASREAELQQPEVVVEDVEPLEVAISTHATLRTDRRLMVEGETNLPDGAQIQVMVEREISRVRWQSLTTVRNGQFGAGPFGSGSGLPDGGYTVRVQLSEASVQPVDVQARIGTQGEYLTGELVSQSRHGLGQVATYSRRFLVGSEPRRTRDQVTIVEDN